MTYADAIKHYNEHRDHNKWKLFVLGEDITEKPEREMTDMVGSLILMVHFPAEVKAFDMKRVAEDAAGERRPSDSRRR